MTVTNVEMTDGVSALRPRAWPASLRRVVGRPAAQDGFPVLDWEKDAGFVVLDFKNKKGAPRTGRP
jgi:hypothetical protein